MAINTSNTVLESAATELGSYTKVSDIFTYPDLGSPPTKLDSTTLSDTAKTSILGLAESPDMTFEAPYDKTVLTTINSTLTGTRWFKVKMGTAGADGIFTWSGQINAFANGGGVDEVRKMTIVCSVSTPIVVS